MVEQLINGGLDSKALQAHEIWIAFRRLRIGNSSRCNESAGRT
jgi:hypothetical protein